MAGETIVALARMMEEVARRSVSSKQRPSLSIANRSSRGCNSSLAAYTAPYLAPVSSSCSLGESYYWGHNAILRIAPFVRHCGLARLPGKPPLGGEILSHDFVEAALMGRAGFEVWLAYDLPGSYEESPPNYLG